MTISPSRGRRAAAVAGVAFAAVLPMLSMAPAHAGAGPAPDCSSEEAATNASRTDYVAKRNDRDSFGASTMASARSGRNQRAADLRDAKVKLIDSRREYVAARDDYRAAPKNAQRRQAYLDTRAVFLRDNEAYTEAASSFRDARAKYAKAAKVYGELAADTKSKRQAYLDAIEALETCQNPPPAPITFEYSNLRKSTVKAHTVSADLVYTGLVPDADYLLYPVDYCAPTGPEFCNTRVVAEGGEVHTARENPMGYPIFKCRESGETTALVTLFKLDEYGNYEFVRTDELPISASAVDACLS